MPVEHNEHSAKFAKRRSRCLWPYHVHILKSFFYRSGSIRTCATPLAPVTGWSKSSLGLRPFVPHGFPTQCRLRTCRGPQLCPPWVRHVTRNSATLYAYKACDQTAVFASRCVVHTN
jgi:hypothetical protein